MSKPVPDTSAGEGGTEARERFLYSILNLCNLACMCHRNHEADININICYSNARSFSSVILTWGRYQVLRCDRYIEENCSLFWRAGWCMPLNLTADLLPVKGIQIHFNDAGSPIGQSLEYDSNSSIFHRHRLKCRMHAINHLKTKYCFNRITTIFSGSINISHSQIWFFDCLSILRTYGIRV